MGTFTGQYFKGLIDELRIYSGALDATAIQQIYNLYVPDTFNPANGPNGMGCVNGIPLDTNPLDNYFSCVCDGVYTDLNCMSAQLFAWYPFESNLADVIGASDGFCSVPGCPSYVSGMDGAAAFFDGKVDFVSIPSALAMGLVNSSFTVMAWVKLNANTSAQVLVGHSGVNAYDQSLQMLIKNTGLFLSFYSDDFQSSLILPIGQWVHIAFRFSKTNLVQSVALNGITQTASFSSPSYAGTSGSLMTIGNWESVSFFSGAMDDLMFYSGYASDSMIRSVFERNLQDTFTPYNGPNHVDCLNNGQRVDTVLYDGSYLCNCSTSTYLGK